MFIRVPRVRLKSYFLYLFYTWITYIVTSTTATMETVTNLTLDCTNGITIISPGYPSPYPNKVVVEWNINVPRDRRILVTFNYFSLEQQKDYIDVDNKVYTGENMQFPPYLATGHTLQIVFVSSPRGRRKGFDISVACFEPTTGDISVRLMDGIKPSEGFIELSSTSGDWMRVCEQSFTERVAEVICGELGYPGVKNITFVNVNTQNCTRAPSCGDDTYRLLDCKAGNSSCVSAQVVKIICHEPGYRGCYKLQTQQLQNSSKFAFTTASQCIYSCKSHGIQTLALMNENECFCSTSAEVNFDDLPKCDDLSPSEKFSIYDASVGFCEEMNDTIGGSWDSNITWFGSIVHLTCMDGYILKGNGTIQCVPGVTPYYPIWNESIPDCKLNDNTHSSERNARIWILWLGLVLGVLAIVIVLAGYITYRKKLRNRKGIRRESEADSPISTSTHDRGGGTSAISGRIMGGTTRQNAGGSIDRSPSSNINPTITTIALSNGTQFAVPDNTPAPLHTDAPPFLRHTGSNASSPTLPSLHQNNQKSINHYVSSPSAPNPYYYASSPDNSVDIVSLEAAYQEPSSVEFCNHAYEGTTDDVHSNIMLENVNPYHYATSSALMEVGGGSTLSYEEAYQVPSAIEMANHEYEGTSDHEHSTAVLSGGISMAYRPLPHRPSSTNCNEGPTLPPRKSSRDPKHFPIKQRESTMDTVNNNFPQACSLVSKGLRHIPKKHEQEKEGMGQDMSPFYHTLEKDELPRSLGQDNQGPYLGDGHLAHNAPISTNSQGNTIHSRVHGNTDLTDTDRMIDNVLYVPMTSCQKKYSHS